MTLHKIREELDTGKPDRVDPQLSDEFFSLLKFKPEFRRKTGPIKSRRQLAEFYDMCQILRDMINIGEETEWNLRSSAQSIYRSIGTYMNRLDEDASVRHLLTDSYKSSGAGGGNLNILNIYEVVRPNESFGFNRKKNLNNVRLLFHGSRVNNFVGILSRGLMLPKCVPHDQQNELLRTDQGLSFRYDLFQQKMN